MCVESDARSRAPRGFFLSTSPRHSLFVTSYEKSLIVFSFFSVFAPLRLAPSRATRHSKGGS